MRWWMRWLVHTPDKHIDSIELKFIQHWQLESFSDGQ